MLVSGEACVIFQKLNTFLRPTTRTGLADVLRGSIGLELMESLQNWHVQFKSSIARYKSKPSRLFRESVFLGQKTFWTFLGVGGIVELLLLFASCLSGVRNNICIQHTFATSRGKAALKPTKQTKKSLFMQVRARQVLKCGVGQKWMAQLRCEQPRKEISLCRSGTCFTARGAIGTDSDH